MGEKQIVIFHPDIHTHKTSNEYTKKMYSLLEKHYNVRSLEWFIMHPFAKGIHALYLNWFENTIGKEDVFIQRIQYMCKLQLLKWARHRNIKICYVVHNKTPHNVSKESPIYKKAAKNFMQKAFEISNTIIELCEHTYGYLQNEFSIPDLEKKIIMVPHGTYTKYPSDTYFYRDKYDLHRKDVVFAFVGKMDKYKNIDIILQSFYKARIEGRLLLVGKIDKEYKDFIQRDIIDNTVVTDFSFVSDEDMSGIMQAVDAVILPYDNTSINSGIMINAFSNGTTVIGTNIEMLQDYNADLVYGYNYTDREEHIINLSRMIKKAYNDMIRGNSKEKGKILEQIVNQNNSWDRVEKSLLTAVR